MKHRDNCQVWDHGEWEARCGCGEAAMKAEPGTVLYATRGSVAHGTYIPPQDPQGTDDEDYMGVVVPGPDHYFGLSAWRRGTKEIKDGPLDIVYYEARKFIGLLMKGNPNVLGLLWTPPIILKPAGELLLRHRDLFLTKQVYKSFAGYANAQLHRMQHAAYFGYLGEKRKELVNRFGYDTKNASHLIRLLRMARDLFATGKMIVRRPDANELIAIKRGEWGLERVKQEADRLFAESRVAVEASRFPTEPDPRKVNALCVRVVRTALGLEGGNDS